MLWRGAYTVSWSISSVSTTRHISTSCCQSRLFRAKRETSRAATAPTVPRQTSATMRSKPRRATAPAADRPRSAPTTSIRETPNACSRPVMAYCRAPLSRLCMTWWGEDCRTSSIALRRRCCGPIVADIITARPRIAGIVHVVQHQPNHQLARLPACSARTRALSRRVLRNAALRPSEQIELIRSVPALAVHPVSISHGSLPDPGHRRPILRTSREPYPAHPTRAMPETIVCEIHLATLLNARPRADHAVEHPQRNFLPEARYSSVESASRANDARLLYDITDPHKPAGPRMPSIKYPAGVGPMGALALGCTTTTAPMRRLANDRPRRSGAPRRGPAPTPGRDLVRRLARGAPGAHRRLHQVARERVFISETGYDPNWEIGFDDIVEIIGFRPDFPSADQHGFDDPVHPVFRELVGKLVNMNHANCHEMLTDLKHVVKTDLPVRVVSCLTVKAGSAAQGISQTGLTT